MKAVAKSPKPKALTIKALTVSAAKEPMTLLYHYPILSLIPVGSRFIQPVAIPPRALGSPH